MSNEPDFGLALEEARRGFDGLAEQLSSLRDRVIQVLGIGGLAASVVGGLVVRNSHTLGLWGWLSVGAFAVLAVLSLLILAPRRVHASQDPFVLVQWAESGATRPMMERDLALRLAEQYEANAERLDRLQSRFVAALFVLLLELGSLIAGLVR